ncbi:MAG: aldo/keto reductase [Planctomycetota bacterium]
MSISLAKRPCGKTPYSITPLCVGAAPLGSMPESFAYEVSEPQAFATLRAFFQSSINFLDTAASYGDGESERRIGLVLKELGGVPPGFVIASKADRDMKSGDFSGDQIKRSVERSLRLLGVDSLPIMHLHDPEWTTFENVMSKGGPLEVLQKFRDEKVIGAIGMAGGPVDMEIRYVKTGAFDALITHNRYCLINRSADELLTLAHGMGMAVFNAAPYGSGVLAKGPTAYPRFAYQEASSVVMERVIKLDALCKAANVPLAAAALQFSLRDPRFTSTIVGVSKPERIQQTLDLAAVKIPDDLWGRLDAVGFDVDDPEATRWK